MSRRDQPIVRGIDAVPTDRAFTERMPTEDELEALPLALRYKAIFESGVRPQSARMKALFHSCCEIAPLLGVALMFSIDTGEPPNKKFHRGEEKSDPLVWPGGYPRKRPKRVPAQPVDKAYSQRMQAMKPPPLWTLFDCGCVETCKGREFHAAAAAEEEEARVAAELRKAELEQAQGREMAGFADALALATQSAPVVADFDRDDEEAAEFAALLVRNPDP